jgi:hypothetical protein
MASRGRDADPGDEPLRRAVRWIERQQRVDARTSVDALVAEAGHRFQLPSMARDILRTMMGPGPGRRR